MIEFSTGALMLRVVAAYLRRTPWSLGRWRAEQMALRLSRTYGPKMGVAEVRTRSGLRMRLVLGDWVDQHIFAVGQYEADVVEVASCILNKGETAIDIGANVGFFSLLFGQLVGASGKVIAFEPQVGIVDRLVQNVSLNRDLRVEIDNRAISDCGGYCEFHCGTKSHSGVGSMRLRADASATTRVEAVALDEVLGPDEPVHLVKIDVEGAELHVLRGMRRIIAERSPNLIVEVSDQFLREMGGSGRELCDMLWQYGYTMYVIRWDGLRVVHAWSDSLPKQFNALFTKKDVSALVRNESKQSQA